MLEFFYGSILLFFWTLAIALTRASLTITFLGTDPVVALSEGWNASVATMLLGVAIGFSLHPAKRLYAYLRARLVVATSGES